MAPCLLRCLRVLCVSIASSALKLSFARLRRALPRNTHIRSTTYAGRRPTHLSDRLLQLGPAGAGGAVRAGVPARPGHLLARLSAGAARTGAAAAPRLS